ncbi:serine/threonine-protein phosphatase [Actinoallomurus spadix]|uniref:PP2C family protein-serine/threonine phosphatase n=1 Tax=Actinoallomurus spadix TaxID=79912 RepID=UPI002092936A|nr:PP2C family protein-serine/threonine phosphatase [Actinoallomurus spadix]MCO5988720.1 serine/threonine-protein phosphatase [Actinoallomurus spadix]
MRRFQDVRAARPWAWWRGRALVLLPLALIAVIMVADFATGPRVHLGPLLIAAPALTASFAGPVEVALIGVAAIGAEVVIAAADRWRGLVEYESHLSSLVLMSVVIVFFSAVRRRHQRQLALVRSVAETAQQVLMRPLPERVGPLRIASLYLTAQEEARIGGDLYGAARIARGTRLIIGDVRGKGLAAVDTAALVIGAFCAAAHQRAALRDLLAFLDGAATVELATSEEGEAGAGENFVTAAVVDIPDEEPRVHIVNRGHPSPLLLTGGRVRELRATRPAPPLGLGNLAAPDAHADSFPFRPGDLLLLYTDGVIETRDADRRFYPLRERLLAWEEDDPGRLVERLHEDLCAYAADRLDDDVAVIAVKRMPGQGLGGLRSPS